MPEDENAVTSIVDGSGTDPAGSAPPAEDDAVDPGKPATDWEAMYKGESKARIKLQSELEAAANIKATLNGFSDRLGAMEQATLNLDLVTASIRDDVVNSNRSSDDLDDENEVTPELSTSYADEAQQRASGLSQSQTLARSKERIERDLETLGDRVSERDMTFIKNTWGTASKEGAFQPGMGSQLEAYVSRLVALDATQRLATASNGGAPSVGSDNNDQGDDTNTGQAAGGEEAAGADDPPSRREQIAAGGGLGTGVKSGSGAAPDNSTVKAAVIESGDPSDAFAAAYAESSG